MKSTSTQHTANIIVSRVVVALVLGLVTTLGVAMLIALFVNQAVGRRWKSGYGIEIALRLTSTPQGAPPGDYLLVVTRAQRIGTAIVEVGVCWAGNSRTQYGSPESLVECTSFSSEMKHEFESDRAPIAWWRADGWPLPALSAEARWLSYDSMRIRRVVGGVLIGPTEVVAGNPVRILPLQPMWTGFIIDTLLFGTLWFATISFRDIRSGLRRRRSSCVYCGYKLMPDQTRCSECGASVK